MKEVAAAISGMTEDQIREIELNNTIALAVAVRLIEIALTDVEIIAEDVPGWLAASEGGLTVALDITVTEVCAPKASPAISSTALRICVKIRI